MPKASVLNKEKDEIKKEDPLTPEEIEYARILEDPVLWCETHLRNPDDPTKFIEFRWYQREMIRYQPKRVWSDKDNKWAWDQRKKLYRCGRRVGKSVCLLAEFIWLAHTNKNYKILLLCPYEEQMRGVWTVLKSMMRDSIAPSRIVEKPFIVEFSNGSVIHGFVGGAKQVDGGGRGSPMRSFGADAIGVMEMDHGIDHVLKPVLIPILLGKAHCRWIGDSTPSGRRGLFYEWCTTPESKGGAKEFHFPSRISPEWSELAEQTARRNAGSEAEFLHEYEAEFGEQVQGIFKSEDIDEIMDKYTYDIADVHLDREYSMGVDWNQAFGVKIYVVERNRKGVFRTFFKHEVPNNEFTQTQAVDRIVEISKKIPLSYIYVDRGFGTVQVELLHKYGKEHPESQLQKIVKAVDFKGNVEIRDPWSKQIVKKPLKPFCVANAARIVENRAISIPEEENHKSGLIGQMRGYNMIETPSGNIVFEAENRDDLLVAWMLALLPFATESGEFSHYEAINTIGRISDPLKLEDKFQRRDREIVHKTRNILSTINTGGMGIKVRRFKPIVAGSTVVPITKTDAPIGSVQYPLRRSPGRNRSMPKRTNF
jgi:replicative DNA helicase